MQKEFTYLDLFAGIGGFHQAMEALNGKCIGFSEIDKCCSDTYKQNYEYGGLEIGDINNLEVEMLPDFDVICGGFPCQPFSKAGKRLGFADESRGRLFYKIIDILKSNSSIKFVILENVRNLADHTENWNTIKRELVDCGFVITEKPIILSPSDFGIPQNRERVYILGIKKEYANKTIKNNGSISESDLNIVRTKCQKNAALNLLEDDQENKSLIIKPEIEKIIFAWEEFRMGVKSKVGSPIWTSYFGAGIDSDEDYEKSIDYSSIPRWKQLIIDRNRKLYISNRDFIDKWLKDYEILGQNKLLKKFEWNCGEDISTIKDGIIQIRQSGIRVKRPNFYPALVAMSTTPIVWDEGLNHFRKISIKEAAKLQSFKNDFIFSDNIQQSYKQLGNAVNVTVVKTLATKLFALSEEGPDVQSETHK